MRTRARHFDLNLELTMSPAMSTHTESPSHRVIEPLAASRAGDTIAADSETIVLHPATTVNVRARGVAHSGALLRSPACDHVFELRC